MANSVSKARTNYVGITDIDKFNDIISRCVTDGEEIEIITHTDTDGSIKYGFYCEDNICGMRIPNEDCNRESCDSCEYYDNCDMDCEYDLFLRELQQVIAPDDALIITTLCYERMRYLQAYTEIVTHKSISGITLSDSAISKAREMLGNPKWTTRNDY